MTPRKPPPIIDPETPNTNRLIREQNGLANTAADEPEAETQRKVMLDVTRHGGRVFRNNVAEGWIGKTYIAKQKETRILYPGDVVIRGARRLHSGLIKGSGDLIGWTPLLIREEHIGQTVAVFMSLEIKTRTGRMTPEQNTWLRAINLAGGVGRVITQDDSVEQAMRWSDASGIDF